MGKQLLAGLWLFSAGCVYYVPVPDQAQRPLSGTSAGAGLTKEDVLRLIRARVSEETIILKIKADGLISRPSAQDIVELKNEGVGDKVIQSMLEPRVVPDSEPSAPATTPRYYYSSPSWPFYYGSWWGHHFLDHHDWDHHGDFNH